MTVRWPSTLFVLGFLALAETGTAQAQACEPRTFETSDYIVCSVDPKKSELRLFLNDVNGKPYRSFSRLASAVENGGEKLVFALNAGMYSDAFSPVGLHVEAGREVQALNTKTIEGPPASVPNFYKKPNGVFFFGEGNAGIVTSDDYVSGEAGRPDFATQSGPMLVIDNTLHPAFIPGSKDRTRRSGVGICEGGLVRFAISENDVNFHDFARLFRDELKCSNALFLDGGRGAGLYDPALRRNDWSWHGGYGPMVGVFEKAGDAE